jgi:nucleotide-binding universal stress UspA family protein
MRTTEVPTGSVVVGIDAARSSVRALDWAADRAALDHRDLLLLHGTGRPTVEPAPGVGLGRPDPFELYDDLVSAGRAILHRATTHAVLRQPELSVHSVVLTADPGQALVDVSTRCSMVVVGSRGRGHMLSLVLGSVSEDVAGRAACPVVVLRPSFEEHARSGVLVGSDGSSESVPVLEFAFHEAWLRGVPLTVVHTIWDVVASTAPAHGVDTVEPGTVAVRRQLAAAVAPLAERYPEVRVRLELGRGVPSECLLAEAPTQDLVVVGHHQRHGFDRLMHGSVALSVLEHASTPVAIVPILSWRAATP